MASTDSKFNSTHIFSLTFDFVSLDGKKTRRRELDIYMKWYEVETIWDLKKNIWEYKEKLSMNYEEKLNESTMFSISIVRGRISDTSRIYYHESCTDFIYCYFLSLSTDLLFSLKPIIFDQQTHTHTTLSICTLSISS